jgi:hypothetical protein
MSSSNLKPARSSYLIQRRSPSRATKASNENIPN